MNKRERRKEGGKEERKGRKSQGKKRSNYYRNVK